MPLQRPLSPETRTSATTADYCRSSRIFRCESCPIRPTEEPPGQGATASHMGTSLCAGFRSGSAGLSYHEDPEIEEHYTATLVYSVSDEGEIFSIDPDLVSCILAPD